MCILFGIDMSFACNFLCSAHYRQVWRAEIRDPLYEKSFHAKAFDDILYGREHRRDIALGLALEILFDSWGEYKFCIN